MTTDKQIDFNLLEPNSIRGLSDQKIDQIAEFQECDLIIDPEIDVMLNDCCSSLSKSDANENIVTNIQPKLSLSTNGE